ncbi:unnamed protein product [Gadus morhua 'NCC']
MIGLVVVEVLVEVLVVVLVVVMVVVVVVVVIVVVMVVVVVVVLRMVVMGMVVVVVVVGMVVVNACYFVYLTPPGSHPPVPFLMPGLTFDPGSGHGAQVERSERMQENARWNNLSLTPPLLSCDCTSEP